MRYKNVSAESAEELVNILNAEKKNGYFLCGGWRPVLVESRQRMDKWSQKCVDYIYLYEAVLEKKEIPPNLAT